MKHRQFENQTAVWILRIALALVMIVFGISQLSTPLIWSHYVPGFLAERLGDSFSLMLRGHALVNIFLGLFLISGLFPRLAALLALLWLAGLTPFAFKTWDIGIRDSALTLSALALLSLLQGPEQKTQRQDFVDNRQSPADD